MVFYILSLWKSGVFCTYSPCTIQPELAAFQVLKSLTGTALLSRCHIDDLCTHEPAGTARF